MDVTSEENAEKHVIVYDYKDVDEPPQDKKLPGSELLANIAVDVDFHMDNLHMKTNHDLQKIRAKHVYKVRERGFYQRVIEKAASDLHKLAKLVRIPEERITEEERALRDELGPMLVVLIDGHIRSNEICLHELTSMASREEDLLNRFRK